MECDQLATLQSAKYRWLRALDLNPRLLPLRGTDEVVAKIVPDTPAGLLLFTPAALVRPDWTRKEAYILMWRRSLDPSFNVFYVCRDGVSHQDLTTGVTC